jgi:hypothetical protein
MAVLCTKCSAEVPAGAQFCAACGTPVAAAAAPPPAGGPSAPPAYAPVAMPSYQAVPGQPIMAPPGSGSSAVKIILVIVAVFVGLGLVGAGAFGFMIWRVSRAIHSHGPHGQLSFVPGGTVTTSGASSFTSDDLGTDIYPGAQSTSGGMRMELPSGSMVTGAYLTSDSKDAVVTFYKSKFGSNASVYDSAESAMISVKKADRESVMVTVSARPAQNNGQTKIVIVHTKSKKTS